MTYSEEITISEDKSTVMQIIADPFKFSGMTGHISILGIQDNKGERSPPQSIVKTDDKYWIGIVVGTKSDKVEGSQGIMDIPMISPNSIEYKGVSDDKKYQFRILFILKPLQEKTRLTVNVEFNIKQGILGRLFLASIRHLRNI
ncbi:hypothetical protein [Acidianus sp. RZ1]|uniref:hypothetical protein n=1 Tax=Acidianus sp. RZ1 TaxID=1540082 RepID=UPI001493126E|nr:hypothetical protein [Acidianus sp. RZ1]NON62126.1 hypothetical protein [Acidianus sp. RZ1]